MKQEVAAALAVAIEGWQLGDAGAMLEMSPGLATKRGMIRRQARTNVSARMKHRAEACVRTSSNATR